MISLRVALAAAIATSLVACASAPRQTEVQTSVKEQALISLDYGERAFSSGQYQQATAFYLEALKSSRLVDHQEGMIAAENALGRAAMRQGRLAVADTYFTEALAQAVLIIAEDLVAAARSNLGELALIRSRIAASAGDQVAADEQTARALDYFEEVATSSSNRRQRDRRAVADHNAASVLKAQGKLTEAIARADAALQVNERSKNYREAANNHYLLGSLYSKLEDYSSAMQHLSQALEYDRLTETSLGIAQGYVAMGLVQQRADQPKLAFQHYQVAYRLYGLLNQQADASAQLPRLVSSARAAGFEDEATRYEELMSEAIR